MLLRENVLTDTSLMPSLGKKGGEKTQGTVLLVEDEKDLLTLLSYHLQKENFTVLQAENGKVACEIIDEKKPDLILLDILMPEMDGWEACTIIREHQDHLISSIPVIMLTALRDEKDKLKGLQLGADAFINKPYSIKEVLLHCQNFVRSRKKHLSLIHNRTPGNASPQKNIYQLLLHELKNHLTIIGGLGGILTRSNNLPKKESELVATINKSAQYLGMIVNDIRLFNEIEDKSLDIPYNHFDLHEMINDIVEMLRPVAEEKGIKLLFSSDAGQNFIHLNKTALKVVLATILENAVKYCDQGSTITVSCSMDSGNVLIAIADNGPGIHEADQPKIFNKNFRAQSTQQRSPGSGLGLYFAKILTEVMDGTLTVESCLGRGTKFTAAFRQQRS
ncbi:MAG: response regulator [Proteobacteria bacterium]|nr:response regulator [Pseudomonadota bacterium]MBU1060357.1 response regulator [Pseudomonadota bacterium]